VTPVTQNKPGPAPRFSVEHIKQALAHAAGITSDAAKLLRCSRKTLYAYYKRYPELIAYIKDEVDPVYGDMAKIGLKAHLQEQRSPRSRPSAQARVGATRSSTTWRSRWSSRG
jgi:hypothetical protein